MVESTDAPGGLLEPAPYVSRNDDIQGLRAIAAILVLIDHSGLAFFADRHGSVTARFLGDMGHIGVAVFFGISGYIMLHTNYQNFGSWRASPDFILKRLLRIVPIYYIGTMIAYLYLVNISKIHISITQVATSLTFVPMNSLIENNGFYPVLGVG